MKLPPSESLNLICSRRVEKERLKVISTSHDGECLTLELNAAKGTPRAPMFRMMALKIPASYLGQVEAW